MRIEYSNDLGPKFGQAFPLLGVAVVRDDLPNRVKQFVTYHELYHLHDQSTWWVWREIKANCYAARKAPLGFIGCVLMSLTPKRIGYYIQRIKTGK